MVYNAEQSITCVKSAPGKGICAMEKTRFKLNICGVDVTVSGDVDRDGAEAIAERVRVRMGRGFKQRLRRDHRESGGHCGHEPERGAFPHGGRFEQAREEADALRTKTKEFAGADGMKAAFPKRK